jgi:hypothetical protein
MPAHVSNPDWQLAATQASQSASLPKAQVRKQLLVTQVLWSAKHPTQPEVISGTAAAMQSAKQLVMSLARKHENPQENTASLTAAPSLHRRAKSVESHWPFKLNESVSEVKTRMNSRLASMEQGLFNRQFERQIGSNPQFESS